MPIDDLLVEDEKTKPKYTAFGWQLNRMEQLLDQAINGYAQLYSGAGREKMISALEMLYVAIIPKLNKEDRIHTESYLIQLREMIDGMTNAYATDANSTVTIIRRLSWSILQIMNLLKDRKGWGIPNTPKISWPEELASALNLTPEKSSFKKSFTVVDNEKKTDNTEQDQEEQTEEIDKVQ